jgi:hypothetical protein
MIANATQFQGRSIAPALSLGVRSDDTVRAWFVNEILPRNGVLPRRAGI